MVYYAEVQKKNNRKENLMNFVKMLEKIQDTKDQALADQRRMMDEHPIDWKGVSEDVFCIYCETFCTALYRDWWKANL